MSIVERMARGYATAWVKWIKEHDGDDVPDYTAMSDIQREAMCGVTSAALRAIKPEDVSDGMLGAFVKVDGGHSLAFFTAEAKDALRRAIAAAIAAGAEQ